MNRRLAHRPRSHQVRNQPRSLPRSHQDYFNQRWVYRPQRTFYPKHALGSGLTSVPWGWRPVRAIEMRLAY
jgi:hypothetical protein